MDRNCKQRTARLTNNELVKALDGVVYSSNQPFCEDKSNPPLCGNKQVSWQLLKYLRTLNPNLAVAVMGGYINTRYDCADLYNRFRTFSSCKDPGYISYNPFDEHAAIAALSHPDLADYYFIDKTVLLCPKATLQSCMVQAKGQPLFYDGHHLTLAFATLLGEKIASSYAQQLVKAGFPAPLPHVM
jgi:hypothetical protein